MTRINWLMFFVGILLALAGCKLVANGWLFGLLIEVAGGLHIIFSFDHQEPLS